MARPRNTVPAYRKHSQTGRAAVSTYRTDGSRTEIILPGRYGSEKSKQEYERLLCQLRANGGQLPADAKKDITIAELVLKFMSHAETYYVDPVTKTATNEVIACQAALRPLCRLHADAPAAEFGPLALQSLRAAMVNGTWLTEEERSRRLKGNRPIGLARTQAMTTASEVVVAQPGKRPPQLSGWSGASLTGRRSARLCPRPGMRRSGGSWI
jgi:hypothetical protein